MLSPIVTYPLTSIRCQPACLPNCSLRDHGCASNPVFVTIMLHVRKFAQGRCFRPALGGTLAQPATWHGLLLLLPFSSILILLLEDLLLARRCTGLDGKGRGP